MGKKINKFGIKAISFGVETDPARIIVEHYVKLYGKNKLSQLIRRIVKLYLSDRPEMQQWKKKLIIAEYQEHQELLLKMIKKKEILIKELAKYNIDYQDLNDKNRKERDLNESLN